MQVFILASVLVMSASVLTLIYSINRQLVARPITNRAKRAEKRNGHSERWALRKTSQQGSPNPARSGDSGVATALGKSADDQQAD